MPSLALMASRTLLGHEIHSLIQACGGCTILYYREEGGVSSIVVGERLATRLAWSEGAVIMVAGADWPCVSSYEVIGGHTPAWLLACSMRVGKGMLATSSPPRGLRSHERSVIAGYIRRLLGEGASVEKIAARMVMTGGSPASLLALVADTRRVPVAIMAGTRLCVKHAGRWAAVSTTGIRDCTIVEESLVVLKLQAGVPRVEVRALHEYR